MPMQKLVFAAILYIFFEIDALVEAYHLFEQVDGIAVAVRFGFKGAFIFCGVAAQDQDIIDAEKMKVDECVFGLAFGKAAADQMRNGIDLIMVHNRGADAYRPGRLRTSTFSKVPSDFFLNIVSLR